MPLPELMQTGPPLPGWVGRKISKRFARYNLRDLLLGAMLGAALSWSISSYFHEETAEELRQLILENVLYEMKLNEKWKYI